MRQPCTHTRRMSRAHIRHSALHTTLQQCAAKTCAYSVLHVCARRRRKCMLSCRMAPYRGVWGQIRPCAQHDECNTACATQAVSASMRLCVHAPAPICNTRCILVRPRGMWRHTSPRRRLPARLTPPTHSPYTHTSLDHAVHVMKHSMWPRHQHVCKPQPAHTCTYTRSCSPPTPAPRACTSILPVHAVPDRYPARAVTRCHSQRLDRGQTCRLM